MTREEIIRMAREADPFGEHGRLYSLAALTPETLERFAALVAKHTLANIDPSSFMSWQEGHEAGRLAEREACAKVCEPQDQHDDPLTAWKIAAAIRARCEK